MRYLTVEQVLFLHARLIGETGGSHGIRDVGLLRSAVARPRASFEGKELYPDLFSKAAALMHSLIKNHPFIDGNKRTGTAAAVLLLRANGWSFEASNAELEEFALKVAGEELAVLEMAEWLRQHSVSRRS
ncbi:MAG TPA: type II toxin-antitoxin system death-on-curing family toxin [Chloroflexi bacterium]|nr:type II toxin-antitoxin system death-on-curing family toxin [Chloroflexota bacterium]